MASDHTLAYYPPYAAPRSWLPQLAFVGLLLLIFVGLDAFSPPPLVAQFGGVEEASRGDAVRQILYLGTAALIGFAALPRYAPCRSAWACSWSAAWQAPCGRRRPAWCCAAPVWK